MFARASEPTHKVACGCRKNVECSGNLSKLVVGITQSLAKEVAKEGITVNAFCPGIIETDMWAYNDEVWGKLLGAYKPGELMAEWVRGIPMGRAGTGEDVAGLVTFLASDDAAYITGQTINVDGGLIMS